MMMSACALLAREPAAQRSADRSMRSKATSAAAPATSTSSPPCAQAADDAGRRAGMSAPLETLRFGSGQTVRRIEDPALVRGQGRFTDDVDARRASLRGLRALADRACPHRRHRRRRARAPCPACWPCYTGAELVAAGVKPIPLAPAFKRPDGQPMARRAAPRAGASSGCATSASRWPWWWPTRATPAQGRGRRGGRRVRRAAGRHRRRCWPSQRGAPRVWDGAPDNISAEVRHGDAAATAAAFARAAHRS